MPNDLPSYKELALAFEEYLACTNSSGEPLAPCDEDFERAFEVCMRALPESERRYL